MLIQSGIILKASFDPSSNDPNNDSKDHAVILYRLKDTCNQEDREKVWKPKSFHIEICIYLPAGCPPSLEAHFATSIHSLGHCPYSYINGVVVCTKPDNNFTRTDLKKDEEGEAYLSCAIPSSRDLGREGYRILVHMLNMVKIEGNTQLPGLVYIAKIVCPRCLSTDDTPLSDCSQLSWSSKDGDEYCNVCQEHVFFSVFDCIVEEVINSNTSNDGIVSELAKPLIRALHVLMSARFLNDTTEKRTREISSNLRALGVNVFIVEAGLGETFGAQQPTLDFIT